MESGLNTILAVTDRHDADAFLFSSVPAPQRVFYPNGPKFAVLLAAFNGIRWIKEQIDSILKQENVNVKIFISVDLCCDQTLASCRQMAEIHPTIQMLPSNERFGHAAANFLKMLGTVDFSAFDYVTLADQDDVWLPTKLLRAHNLITSIKADAYSSNVIAFWADGRKRLIEKSQEQVRWDFLFEAAGPGCTYVIRKDLACAFQSMLKSRGVDVQKVGLHDWFIYAFARSNGYRWIIDEQPGMLYRQHENNQVGVNKGWRALRHRAGKVLSGWGLTQSVLIAELVGLGNDPFVKRWAGGSKLGLLWLAAHAWQCRRRFRDKLFFALSCLLLCVLGERRQ
jgi:rhamnosyltransferase